MTTLAAFRARVARAWPVAKYVIGLALAALVFDQLTDQKGELAGTTTALRHLRWAWVVLGVVTEAASLLAFAALQRKLLRAGRVEMSLGRMAAITVAANSINNSLPAGPLLSSLFTFRQFRRHGVDEAVAGWSVVATFVVTSVTLAMVAGAGAIVAGAEGARLGLVGVIVAYLIVALAGGAIFVQKQALVRAASAVMRMARRRNKPSRSDLAARVDRIIARLTVVHLSPAHVVGALSWGCANWLLDCGCLAVSFLAVGAGVPWEGLLLAYGAGQLAANLPITPGGLGVVEGSLTIAIVAYGGSTPSAVAAVLLYRLLSFWLTLPIGWGTWAWLAWTGRRTPWPAPDQAGSGDRTATSASRPTAGGITVSDGDIGEAAGQ
jgi:putative heme transporter